LGDFQAGNCPDTLLDTVSHVPSIDSGDSSAADVNRFSQHHIVLGSRTEW